MILAWTAAFAVFIAAAICVTLALIALASVAVPPGMVRTVLQVILALLGLLVAILMTWS